MNPVSIVTIKNKVPLYKKDEPANAIEVIELEEVGFELVAQKDLYQIGDKAIYIQPDYNVSDISLFESYIRPNGDESKSMLGKVEGLPRRIRAKKFTLSKEPNGDPVYSNGILLPYNEVALYLEDKYKKPFVYLDNVDLTKELNITKYEEPEPVSKSGLKSGQTEGKFPEGLYKTDEENINNLWNHIEKHLKYPVTLVGTEKVDGSSITIGVTPKIPEGFICSRNLRKKLTIKKVTGRRNKKWYEKLLFWTNPDLNLYTEVENDDDFVRYGKPYLDKLLKWKEDTLGTNYTHVHKPFVVLRGELNGGKLKGSGNKNNPASKEQPNIKFFGIDEINDYGEAEKMGATTFFLRASSIGLPIVKEVFYKEFNSKEELLSECNSYFKENMIEGIVVRTPNSKFSAKIMNLHYDSMK